MLLCMVARNRAIVLNLVTLSSSWTSQCAPKHLCSACSQSSVLVSPSTYFRAVLTKSFPCHRMRLVPYSSAALPSTAAEHLQHVRCSPAKHPHLHRQLTALASSAAAFQTSVLPLLAMPSMMADQQTQGSQSVGALISPKLLQSSAGGLGTIQCPIPASTLLAP